MFWMFSLNYKSHTKFSRLLTYYLSKIFHSQLANHPQIDWQSDFLSTNKQLSQFQRTVDSHNVFQRCRWTHPLTIAQLHSKFMSFFQKKPRDSSRLTQFGFTDRRSSAISTFHATHRVWPILVETSCGSSSSQLNCKFVTETAKTTTETKNRPATCDVLS